jgi:hypothetical protein
MVAKLLALRCSLSLFTGRNNIKLVAELFAALRCSLALFTCWYNVKMVAKLLPYMSRCLAKALISTRRVG